MNQKYTIEFCKDKMRELTEIIREQTVMIEVIASDVYLSAATQEQMRLNRALLELYIGKYLELHDEMRGKTPGYRASDYHDLEWGKQSGTDWNLDERR